MESLYSAPWSTLHLVHQHELQAFFSFHTAFCQAMLCLQSQMPPLNLIKMKKLLIAAITLKSYTQLYPSFPSSRSWPFPSKEKIQRNWKPDPLNAGEWDASELKLQRQLLSNEKLFIKTFENESPHHTHDFSLPSPHMDFPVGSRNFSDLWNCPG